MLRIYQTHITSVVQTTDVMCVWQMLNI